MSDFRLDEVTEINCTLYCGCGAPWYKPDKPCANCGQAPIRVYLSAEPDAELTRLRAVEKAAREVVNETVIIRTGEFATFEGHWVQVEKYAVEALRSALGENPEGKADSWRERVSKRMAAMQPQPVFGYWAGSESGVQTGCNHDWEMIQTTAAGGEWVCSHCLKCGGERDIPKR